MLATIKGLNCEKGFCFLAVPDGGPDVFCHVRDMIGVLYLSPDLRGKKVDCDVEETDRGPKARNARLVVEEY